MADDPGFRVGDAAEVPAVEPRSRGLAWLVPALAVIFFVAALWLVQHELRHYRYHQVMAAVQALPRTRLLLAVALTALNYLILTGYDFLALRYVARPLAYARTAFAAFAGYAVGQALGFPLLTAAPVRYRLYSGWGLSAIEIAQVVAFYSFTFWLGYLAVSGMALLLHPPILAILPLPFGSARVLGGLFLLLLAAYGVWSLIGRGSIGRGDWRFAPPRPALALAQTLLASADWVVAASVLYVLLPPRTTFPTFLTIFMVAQLAGVLSHVPGGLGVFEAVVLLLLPAEGGGAAAVGALLAYRAVYYLLPLAGAVLALGTHEALQRREGVKRVAGMLRGGWEAIAPVLLAGAVFLSGAILLFSGATPSLRVRLHLIAEVLPLSVIELSHFVGSVVGSALLIVAWGLQRRLDGAFQLTVGLLLVGIAASLLKGLDYEEASALAFMLVVLLASRRSFYRRTSLTAERFDPQWLMAAGIVVAASVFLGFFTYKHVAYSSELWWHFALHADAPRFLRASVGAVAVLFLFGAVRLLRPAKPEDEAPTPDVLDLVAERVARSPYAYACLALLGDKRFLLGEADSFLMYGVAGRSWISMGDPLGSDEQRSDLAWRFRGLAHRYGGWPVFYQVRAENLPLYIDLGLTLLKLGEQARVRLDGFSLEGSGRKGLRYTVRKLEREGCVLEVLPPGWTEALLPELRRISNAWLAAKNTREKRFSLGSFRPDYLRRLPLVLVRHHDDIVAFANLWPGAGNEELSVDLMRYDGSAPPGVMDFLFSRLMEWGRQTGYRWFDLGTAPLAGLESRPLAPVWNRVAALVYRYGDHFYGFQGLRQYKAKFDPEWVPKYLASPGGLALPAILTSTASLISGGLEGTVRR